MNLHLTLQHNDLLPVYLTGAGNQAVNLRDIHTALDAGKDFTSWAKAKIKEHRLAENQDFVILTLKGENSGRGRARKEYVLRMHIAKRVAMGVNTVAGDRVKDYFIRCEELAIAALAPKPTAARKLTDFTSQQVQKQCVKEVGAVLYTPDNSPEAIKAHHSKVSMLLTGCRPSEYVKAAVAKGLRVGSFSARKLLRRLDPAKAATAAFLDDARARGKSLAQLEAAGVVLALPQAFDALLRAGYSMEELGA